jgi:hypothetical protein
MNKLLKYILIILVAVIVVGLAAGIYLYNKPHKNIERSKADFKMPASQLYNEFSNNENTANQKYLDKTIEVIGIVADKSFNDKGEITLVLRAPSDMSGVSCTIDPRFTEKAKLTEKGKQVKIKGTCTGILLDVVLIHCVIEE